MAEQTSWLKTPADLAILRELAKRLKEIGDSPTNAERRRLWYALDEGRAERPMVLAEAWVAFEDLPDSQLKCREEWAQRVESTLRFDIFVFDKIRDDHVVEPWFNINWDLSKSDYGVEVRQEYAERVSGNVSSRRWEAPIKDLDRDLGKLKPRTFSVDREKTLAWKTHLEEVFDGIIGVRMRGGFWWTTGMTQNAIDLIGLEKFMESMYTNPDGLHRLMRFLQEDTMALSSFVEREGLLSLNNEDDYIGSGSMGYTRALPEPDWKPGDPVRLKDIWVLSESQESVGCGPSLFEEFVFRYQKPVIERYGRCYYGCCEPVHDRWPLLRTLPNIRRFSISPWCDQAFMAEVLGCAYVFSRKPNPSLISMPQWDEEPVRSELKETLTLARNCNVELIMKDVHTLCGQPERMARWVDIAREMVDACA